MVIGWKAYNEESTIASLTQCAHLPVRCPIVVRVKPFYTIDEVAEFLDLDRKTIIKYIKIGKLESERIGRKYMIPLSSLTAMSTIWESIQIANATRR